MIGDGGQIKFEIRDNVCNLHKFDPVLLFFALVLTLFFYIYCGSFGREKEEHECVAVFVVVLSSFWAFTIFLD